MATIRVITVFHEGLDPGFADVRGFLFCCDTSSMSCIFLPSYLNQSFPRYHDFQVWS